MEILLVRHGQTEWNAAEIFRGRADVPLNETGVRQAGLLGEYLAGTAIEAIYSSPLQRALKTAEAIAGFQGLRVETTGGLIDFNYGEWQCLPHDRVKAVYPELYKKWLEHPDRVRMPDGESLADVRKRAVAVVDRVTGTRHAGWVVLVSHRVVHKVLFCALMGLSDSHFWNVRLDNCGITRFECENKKYVLAAHNDTSFLKQSYGVTLADF